MRHKGTEKEFARTSHGAVVKRMDDFFDKSDRQFGSSLTTRAQKRAADKAFSDAFTIVGQEAAKIRNKVAESEMREAGGTVAFPHWSRYIEPAAIKPLVITSEDRASMNHRDAAITYILSCPRL